MNLPADEIDRHSASAKEKPEVSSNAILPARRRSRQSSALFYVAH
jgi:hypothetical protein